MRPIYQYKLAIHDINEMDIHWITRQVVNFCFQATLRAKGQDSKIRKPFSLVQLWSCSCRTLRSIMSQGPFHALVAIHDNVIKWNFPRYWPFVRGIHRSPVNSPHKGQWRGALMFSLICAWTNAWVSNREAGDLRRHWVHYGVTVMFLKSTNPSACSWNEMRG